MKVVDFRNAWQAEGMRVATLPANAPVDDRSLLAYYEVYPGHRNYAALRKPCRFDRYVILKPTGGFVIVPMNPATYVVVED